MPVYGITGDVNAAIQKLRHYNPYKVPGPSNICHIPAANVEILKKLEPREIRKLNQDSKFTIWLYPFL